MVKVTIRKKNTLIMFFHRHSLFRFVLAYFFTIIITASDEITLDNPILFMSQGTLPPFYLGFKISV